MKEINNEYINKMFCKPKMNLSFPLFTLFFDGSCKGNPGPSGIGAVLYDVHQQEMWCGSKLLQGNFTNNQSEYHALLYGLQKSKEMKISHLQVFGDSQLVIHQVNGIYQVKNSSLLELYHKVKKMEKEFEWISFSHVVRENNKRADELSNVPFRHSH
jgi:ribonuclease HI